MSDQGVTRQDLEIAKLEAVRLANEGAEKRIVSAADAVVTSVTLQIAMSEKVLAEKIKTKTAWAIGMFIGGQAIAGVTAAMITRTTPADAGRTAIAVLNYLI